MQSRFNLKPVLQSLGISDVFSPSAADFRGISGRTYQSLMLRNNHKHHQFKSRIHSVKIKPSV